MVIKKEHPNIKILEAAIHKLGPLVDEMVFLGGCATCLLLTDPATPPPRVTYDVDVIVEAASLLDYHKLSEKLRRHNFSEDMSSEALICRWRCGETILDVMPTHCLATCLGIKPVNPDYRLFSTALIQYLNFKGMADTMTNQYVPDYQVTPGEVLQDYLEGLGMTQAELAAWTGLPLKTVNDIIKCNEPSEGH